MYAIYKDPDDTTSPFVAVTLDYKRRSKWYPTIPQLTSKINTSLFILQNRATPVLLSSYILLYYYTKTHLLTIEEAHLKYPEYFI